MYDWSPQIPAFVTFKARKAGMGRNRPVTDEQIKGLTPQTANCEI